MLCLLKFQIWPLWQIKEVCGKSLGCSSSAQLVILFSSPTFSYEIWRLRHVSYSNFVATPSFKRMNNNLRVHGFPPWTHGLKQAQFPAIFFGLWKVICTLPCQGIVPIFLNDPHSGGPSSLLILRWWLEPAVEKTQDTRCWKNWGRFVCTGAVNWEQLLGEMVHFQIPSKPKLNEKLCQRIYPPWN